jgi:hypothetical protein
MAIAIEMEFAGATLDQYDQVIEKMGFESRGQGAPDALFHWAAETDGGIKVVDVWESREAFDSFAEAKIGPHTAEVGIAPPTMTFHELHSYLTAG